MTTENSTASTAAEIRTAIETGADALSVARGIVAAGDADTGRAVFEALAPWGEQLDAAFYKRSTPAGGVDADALASSRSVAEQRRALGAVLDTLCELA